MSMPRSHTAKTENREKKKIIVLLSVITFPVEMPKRDMLLTLADTGRHTHTHTHTHTLRPLVFASSGSYRGLVHRPGHDRVTKHTTTRSVIVTYVEREDAMRRVDVAPVSSRVNIAAVGLATDTQTNTQTDTHAHIDTHTPTHIHTHTRRTDKRTSGQADG